VLDNPLPDPLFYKAGLHVLDHFVELCFHFELVLLLEELLGEPSQCVLHVRLDKPELFIALVLQDLAEEDHVMVDFPELLDAFSNGLGIVNDEGLEAVLLVQISIHVLLHRLPRLLALVALLVELYFRAVDISDHIFQLFQR